MVQVFADAAQRAGFVLRSMETPPAVAGSSEDDDGSFAALLDAQLQQDDVNEAECEADDEQAFLALLDAQVQEESNSDAEWEAYLLGAGFSGRAGRLRQ